MKILKKYFKSRIIPVTIFGMAMGLMEAVIVVYLRKLYFPDGFGFPLVIPDDHLIIFAELIRELATLVMLLTLAIVAGKSFLTRFSWFLFAFAVWDLMYYAGLKIFLDWPSNLLTWDILFLIPVTWVGPVLAPVLCSLMMILLAFTILQSEDKGCKIQLLNWILILLGAFFILITFIADFGMMILEHDLSGSFFSLLENHEYLALISDFTPEFYNWPLFTLGAVLIMFAIFRILRCSK